MRESERDTALAWGTAAESTCSRRAAVRGRARDRRRGGEGIEERKERRVTRGRGDHLASPETAKGHAP